MRILLPTDGSGEADRAQSLIASIAWPDPSSIEVLAVGPALEERPDTRARRYETIDGLIREAAATMLTSSERALSGPGREVSTTLLFGRPASAIVEEAQRTAADLVVMGSRGRGPITSALLGSVSAEVVDHAPCPVLIARRTTLRSLVLGVDGSDGAREAEEIVASWPFLAALPVTVLSVADLIRFSTAIDAGGAGMMDPSVYQELLDDLHATHEALAREAAERLQRRGLKAQATIREGSPALELMEAARAGDADLIVTGTRGRTGLARLMLGSVARTVLLHSPVSVLTVRTVVHRS